MARTSAAIALIPANQLPVSSIAREVPLERIRESPSNHRTVWGDDKWMEEFRDGVKFPTVARLVAPDTKGRDVELVAGARRYRASVHYKFPTLPVVLKELTDREVCELQVIENFQRHDGHPLDEAAWYDDLAIKHRVPLEEIASKVGRSVEYVRRRRRLMTLGENAREAFAANQMDLGAALLIAGIADHALQDKAVEEMCQSGYVATKEDAHNATYTFVLLLSKASFDKKSADLYPEAGACTVCPHNTDTHLDLLQDLDAEKATCTKPSCFKEKEKLFVQLKIAKAKNSGREVLKPSEAKKLFRKGFGGTFEPKADTNYVDLATKIDNDPKGRTYAQLLPAKAKETASIAVTPDGKAHDVIERKELGKLLKEHGLEVKVPAKPKASTSGSAPRKESATDVRRKHHEKVAAAAMPRLVTGAAVKTTISEARLQQLLVILAADTIGHGFPLEHMEAFGFNVKNEVRYGQRDIGKHLPVLTALTNSQLLGILAIQTIHGGNPTDYDTGEYEPLFAGTCEFFGVDLKKLSLQISGAPPLPDRGTPEWLKHMKTPPQVPLMGQCHGCGCTDDKPCEGGCAWVDHNTMDLCTACSEALIAAQAPKKPAGTKTKASKASPAKPAANASKPAPVEIHDLSGDPRLNTADARMLPPGPYYARWDSEWQWKTAAGNSGYSTSKAKAIAAASVVGDKPPVYGDDDADSDDA